MKNRFNNISSKEWLPFQKSWFLSDSTETLYEKHIRFFIKYDDPEHAPTLFYYGKNKESLLHVAEKNGARIVSGFDEPVQYALIDVRETVQEIRTIEEWETLKAQILSMAKQLYPLLTPKRFITILIPNHFLQDHYFPAAWDLAYSIATGLSLKDEKIGCLPENTDPHFENGIFYVINFRKDDRANGRFENKTLHWGTAPVSKKECFPRQWGIIKPPPRDKTEILHPAKFPENLIKDFISFYTRENDNVFDPMTGTGSTQLAAVQLGRNAYGTELSSFFTRIANNRLQEFLSPSLFSQKTEQPDYKILNKDARDIGKNDFPAFDYIITSPPYWNMLNMKGAENQAKRKQKGLRVNYSDDAGDLGNMEDYDRFLSELVNIYFHLAGQLKPNGYMTIIVKNIKKKGVNYPFAWDLAKALSKKFVLLPEFFWLQDDINLAPYGYGNTFVSNTFHHYCLNFKKK
jgi:DNA modification methylase